MTDKISTFVDNEIRNGIRIVTLNRPEKKNAITLTMYEELAKILDESANLEDVLVVVITGAGNYYSSGNDITSALAVTADSDDPLTVMKNANNIYKNFVDSIIRFPKLLVGVVNGPAIGIAATTLGLFDIVYASDKAYFHTPFSALGLVAEGCSTYTFPKIMGTTRAGEMLYLGRKMTALEAVQCGFVSKVFRDEDLHIVWKHLQQVSSLSSESILATKRLVRKWDREILLEVNAGEAEELIQRWESPEVFERFTAFLSRRNKL